MHIATMDQTSRHDEKWKLPWIVCGALEELFLSLGALYSNVSGAISHKTTRVPVLTTLLCVLPEMVEKEGQYISPALVSPGPQPC